MLRESACEGWVLHRRPGPAAHAFRYPVWMLCMDVDRLGEKTLPLLSIRHRLAPLSMRQMDFPRSADPDGPPEDIRTAINRRLAAQGLPGAEQVFLLTQPRSWGWLFNPVSFYFCYRGGLLIGVVAEVTNTPWNEVHTYVLDASSGGDALEVRFPKRFHVSPFLPMDVDYHWRIKAAGDGIEIAMRLLREGQETFFAGLYLQARPLTSASLRRGAFAYPLQNVWTLIRIYWQALRLWRKGAPFYAHPQKFQEARST